LSARPINAFFGECQPVLSGSFRGASILQIGFENTNFVGNLELELSTDFMFKKKGA